MTQRARSIFAILGASAAAIVLAPNPMLRSIAREPMGAEDKGAENHTPSIPEPLVFDLVRGLGARKGECEINTLAMFPLDRGGRASDIDFDRHGPASASRDRGGIEWAPEIEYAIADGFAVEFELPFEDRTLEAYKFAAQWTFGTAMGGRFIDGAQVIVEPDVDFQEWQLTFLYLAGLELDNDISLLTMVGLRPELEQGHGLEATDGIFNLAVFRDIDRYTTVAIESDFTFGDADRTTCLVVPQLDREITDQMQIQCGIGVGFASAATEPLAIVRAIYSR